MIKTIILTAIFILFFYMAPSYGMEKYVHPQKWIILSFFVAMSFLFHQLIEQGTKNNREHFVQFYLASVVIRLLLCMIFVGAAFYFNITNKPLFTITFLVLYLCYTIFEISNVSRKLHRN